MIGVYAIFRKIDDRCMYVGESKHLERRIKAHLDGKTKNLFNKEEYYCKILETHDIDDHKYRLQREVYWINELNPELNIIRDGTNWNHFLHLSNEHKQKISNTKYGKNISDEHKQKISIGKKNKHCKWINNGTTLKCVPPNELQSYLDNGWVLGRKCICKTLSKKRSEINFGRKWINNGIINKFVSLEELQSYLDSGWIPGMLKKSR